MKQHWFVDIRLLFMQHISYRQRLMNVKRGKCTISSDICFSPITVLIQWVD